MLPTAAWETLDSTGPRACCPVAGTREESCGPGCLFWPRLLGNPLEPMLSTPSSLNVWQLAWVGGLPYRIGATRTLAGLGDGYRSVGSSLGLRVSSLTDPGAEGSAPFLACKQRQAHVAQVCLRIC